MCLCIFRRFPFSQYFLNEHNVRFYLFFFVSFTFPLSLVLHFMCLYFICSRFCFVYASIRRMHNVAFSLLGFLFHRRRHRHRLLLRFSVKYLLFSFCARVCVCVSVRSYSKKKKKKYAHDTLCVFANVNGIAFGRYDEFHIHIYLYRYT